MMIKAQEYQVGLRRLACVFSEVRQLALFPTEVAIQAKANGTATTTLRQYAGLRFRRYFLSVRHGFIYTSMAVPAPDPGDSLALSNSLKVRCRHVAHDRKGLRGQTRPRMSLKLGSVTTWRTRFEPAADESHLNLSLWRS